MKDEHWAGWRKNGLPIVMDIYIKDDGWAGWIEKEKEWITDCDGYIYKGWYINRKTVKLINRHLSVGTFMFYR